MRNAHWVAVFPLCAVVPDYWYAHAPAAFLSCPPPRCNGILFLRHGLSRAFSSGSSLLRARTHSAPFPHMHLREVFDAEFKDKLEEAVRER